MVEKYGDYNFFNDAEYVLSNQLYNLGWFESNNKYTKLQEIRVFWPKCMNLLTKVQE